MPSTKPWPPPNKIGLPTSPPVVWRVGSWETYEPWDAPINGVVIHVPKGWQTDLASVPRLGWLFISPTDLGGVGPPLIHDLIYQLRGRLVEGGFSTPPTKFTRRAADRVFREAMRTYGVGRFKRRVAWAGVRLFGWFPWPPSKTTLHMVWTRAAHTAWQAAGGVGVTFMFRWSAWFAIAIAAGLSAVKTLWIVPLSEQVAGTLYR